MHLRILEGSEAVVLAIDAEDDDHVVGFITAVGDGVLASYIPLLEVLPAYHRRALGPDHRASVCSGDAGQTPASGQAYGRSGV